MVILSVSHGNIAARQLLANSEQTNDHEGYAKEEDCWDYQHFPHTPPHNLWLSREYHKSELHTLAFLVNVIHTAPSADRGRAIGYSLCLGRAINSTIVTCLSMLKSD